MPKAFIDPDKCVRCVKCHAARACPKNVIFRISDEEANVVDMAHCHGCGDCVSKCPAHAVILRDG